MSLRSARRTCRNGIPFRSAAITFVKRDRPSLQELAFTLRDGIEYVQYGIDAGLDVDDFAPRISFFFNSHSDFFEEIAKFRAARRMWAEVMRDRFGASKERSWKLRFHTQTAGVSLTAQQPYNNVVRTALQALAAVLGGTQSLHTNSLDEALALPTEEAATLALRTQQIIAHESGVANIVDPLGGSYFLERLTLDMERRRATTSSASTAWAAWSKRSSRDFRRTRSRRRRIGFSSPSSAARRSSSASTISCRKMRTRCGSSTSTRRPRRDSWPAWEELRKTRDNDRVRRALDALRETARGNGNTMYPLFEAVRAYATVGEMCDALREVWGEYEEVPLI